MDLNLLALFVQVADSKGFTAAARELGVKRSALSRSVAKLERELGVQLFHRTTRSVALSSAGEALYARVASQVGSLLGAVEDIPERREKPSGHLRITMPHDLAAGVFPPLLAGFNRRYPQIRLDVRVTNRTVDLVAEGFDAAVRPGPAQLPESSLRVTRLGQAEASFYASPAYLARAGTPRSMEEASAHDWISGPGRWQLPSLPVLEVDDMLVVRGAVLEHIGLGALPSFLAREDVILGRLVRLPFDGLDPVGFLYLLTPPGDHVPRKRQVFREYVMSYFREHPLAQPSAPRRKASTG